MRITKPLGSQDDGSLPLGGAGSGNWGHAGRKGQRGGSMPRSSAMSIAKGKTAKERQAAAKASGTKADSGKTSGGSDNLTMQERYDAATPRARKLADATGILPLDGKAEWYVEGLKEDGGFNNLPERVQRLQKHTQTDLQGVQRDVEINIEKRLKSLEEAYDQGDWKTVGEITISALEENEMRRTGVGYDALTGVPRVRLDELFETSWGAQDQYTRRDIESDTPAQKAIRYQEVQKLIIANSMNQQLYYMRGASAGVSLADTDAIKTIRIDDYHGTLKLNLGDTNAMYNTVQAAISREKALAGSVQFDISKMVALRTPSRAVAQAQVDAVARSHDRRNHRFTTEVNGVYEIVPQKNVRDAYQAAADSRNHVMTNAYHGTDFKAAVSISGNGFRVPKAAKAGRMMGDGVYLANNSSKSVQYIGTSYGRGRTRGVLLSVAAARGQQVNWTGTRFSNARGDTIFGAKGTSMGGSRGLLNDEWCVKDPQAILPMYWIDCTRR